MMVVRCDKCGKIYDDAVCWTICPHGPLGFAPDSYCPKCDTVILVYGKCQHQLEAETTKVCDECAGTGCDHPESAAYRNSEYGTDCPKCKGDGHILNSGCSQKLTATLWRFGNCLDYKKR